MDLSPDLSRDIPDLSRDIPDLSRDTPDPLPFDQTFSKSLVANVKKSELKRRGIADALEWSHRLGALYIGRAMPYVPGADRTSRWANPFSVERYGRARCLELFEAHVRANRGGLWDALEDLEGKELGCWCHPEPCHGDVLLRLLEEKKARRD
jgi:hypothetical protein